MNRIGCTNFGILAAQAILVGFVCCGCAAPPSHADLHKQLLKASAGENIVFQSHGGSVDVRLSGEDVLTLSDAVRQALRTNSNIQAALARVRAAEADANQARLLPNPILSVVTRFSESSAKPVIEADLGMDLLSLLERPGHIEAADDRLRSTSAELLTVVLDAISEVEERYASVQSLDAQIPVLEQQHALVVRLQKLAEDRLKYGEGTRLDVTTLETQRLSLELESAQKQLERRQERLDLTRLLGAPSGSAQWRLSSWTAPPVVSNEKDWIRTALSRRPEIAATRWELAALGVETRLTRFAPFEPTEAGVKAERDLGETWTVGPAIATPIPLFDWGQAKRTKAAALASEAEHKLTEVQRNVIAEVRKAHAAFLEAMSAVELSRDRLLPAEILRHKDTEAAYTAGQTDVTALVLADQDLLVAKAKRIELEEQATVALVKLRRAVGGADAASNLTSKVGPASRPALPKALDK